MKKYTMKWGAIRVLYAISIPVASIPHAFLNNYRGNEHIPYSFIDGAIPLIPVFVVPYLFWFAFVALIIIVMAFSDDDNYYQLLAAMICSTFAAIIIYYIYPTTVPRSVVTGNDIFSRLLKLVYGMDNPYDCLPSLHILYAFLVTVFFCRNDHSRIAKGLTLVFCILICLSTLFIKQHYILDVIAALVLGSLSYFIFTRNRLRNMLSIRRGKIDRFQPESLEQSQPS